MLSYDYENALKVGEISLEDINKVDFANAYSNLMEKLDNGVVGFRDVIYDENLDKYKSLNGYEML